MKPVVSFFIDLLQCGSHTFRRVFAQDFSLPDCSERKEKCSFNRGRSVPIFSESVELVLGVGACQGRYLQPFRAISVRTLITPSSSDLFGFVRLKHR